MLKAGLAADVTVFDAATIVDRATFSDPHHYSVGVRYVGGQRPGHCAKDTGCAPAGRAAGAVLR